jgi:GntR family transcriptional regulator, histidine utilization repressor
MPLPRYDAIKQALRARIESAELRPGDRVPSENELAVEFEVSRMTARRALLELAAQGVLFRTQGLGSFVADTRPMSSVTQVRNIAEEIAQRGHHHSSCVIEHAAAAADKYYAQQLALLEGDTVFHSLIVHTENEVAIQLESRFVNPTMAPNYLQQNFNTTTPSAYLSAVAPLTEAEHTVEAVTADAASAELLSISARAPCLKITRRTFSANGVMSLAILLHPGDRYRLGSHISQIT